MPPIRGGSNDIKRQNHSSRESPEPEVQPPRPPNAWILYRSAKLQQIAKSTEYGTTMAEISKVIGKWWKEESAETKTYYNELAKKAKEEHARKYPDYKFRPVKKEDKARPTPKPRGSSRSTSGGNSARARAAPYQIPATAPATPACTLAPVLAHPRPQMISMSAEQIYALQYHSVQHYGAAGPSPPMSAWDGDDTDITPLSLSESESPELFTPPTSLSDQSPLGSLSPVTPELVATHTPDSESSGAHLFMPESSSASPDDLYLPSMDNFGWNVHSNETLSLDTEGGWPPTIQALFGADPMNTLLLDMSMSTGFDLQSGSFEVDFGNLGSSSTGQSFLTPEYITLPDSEPNPINLGTVASFDFGFAPTPADVGGVVQPVSVRDPALQEQNLPAPGPAIETAEVSTSKYRPPAGAVHSANRRVGGNWRPRVSPSD